MGNNIGEEKKNSLSITPSAKYDLIVGSFVVLCVVIQYNVALQYYYDVNQSIKRYENVPSTSITQITIGTLDSWFRW